VSPPLDFHDPAWTTPLAVHRAACQRATTRLVKRWARIWQLPRGAWGALAEAAYVEAEALCHEVDRVDAHRRNCPAHGGRRAG
jgi:hypothetical protein